MEILTIGLLGGLLGLDATAVGQFMVSRPLVAGLLTGVVMGDPMLGVTLGAVLEMYLLVSFPTGGARFPDGVSATVVAVGTAAVFDGGGAAPLALACGLVWGQVAGRAITGQRRINTAFIAGLEGEDVTPGRLALRHLVAVALDFARGALMTIIGVIAARALLGAFVEEWPLGEANSAGLMLVGGAVSVGILLNDAGGFRKKRRWLVAGLALGIVGARFL